MKLGKRAIVDTLSISCHTGHLVIQTTTTTRRKGTQIGDISNEILFLCLLACFGKKTQRASSSWECYVIFKNSDIGRFFFRRIVSLMARICQWKTGSLIHRLCLIISFGNTSRVIRLATWRLKFRAHTRTWLEDAIQSFPYIIAGGP